MGESTPTEVEIGTPTYRSGCLGIDKVLEQNVLNSDELKRRAHTLALENITVYHRRGSFPFRKIKKDCRAIRSIQIV